MSSQRPNKAVTTTEVTLREYERSPPIELTQPDRRFLKREINESATRVQVMPISGDSCRLKALQYVGIIALPSGTTIEIRPQLVECNLLHCLRYGHDISARTYGRLTPAATGSELVTALAILFEAELRTLLRRGLATGYRTTSETEKYLRGRLDVQIQLQRQGPQPTQFECTYDELTPNILLNQGVLYATEILSSAVPEPDITQQLRAHKVRLEKNVNLTPVEPLQFAAIDLSRLHGQYTDIYPLVELILANTFIGSFRHGESRSFSILMDMNTVFEKVVEQAFREFGREMVNVEVIAQRKTSDLLEGNELSASLEPDVLLRLTNGTGLLVADAKWKTGTIKNDDLYQLAAYQQAHDCRGCLVYPTTTDGSLTTSRIRHGHQMGVLRLPISGQEIPFETFSSRIRATIEKLDGEWELTKRQSGKS